MLRSPTVIIASIGLWGMNVYFFRLFGIDYVRVLNLDLVKEREAKLLAESGTEGSVKRSNNDIEEDSKSLSKRSDFEDTQDDDTCPSTENLSAIPFGNRITWGKLVGLSFFLMMVLHLSEKVWVDYMGGSSIGAVFCFYAVAFVGITFPMATTKWLRTATGLVLFRTYELVNPRCSCVVQDPKGPRPIPFIDVFYADAMCSLSKVFFDWGMLWHLASHYPNPVPKSVHSILIPSCCAAIPYIIRARQCLIMYTVGRLKVSDWVCFCVCVCAISLFFLGLGGDDTQQVCSFCSMTQNAIYTFSTQSNIQRAYSRCVYRHTNKRSLLKKQPIGKAVSFSS